MILRNIFNNYSPEVNIVEWSSRRSRGDYSTILTEPEANNCFSITGKLNNREIANQHFKLNLLFNFSISLRASSPIWASEPRENARARGRGKESLQPSLINFHFHPGNPGTPQSVKTVTANVPQIRKVTTACQVSLDSRGRVELFIYKSLSQQHQGNVFNHWYVFFFTGTSNFNVSARIRTHYFDSRFVYFWKVVHTAV